MKTTIIVIAIVAGVFSAFAGNTNELGQLLQRGLFEEEANHNVDAAIEAYRSVVVQFDKDRKFAATAMIRLAECYRKQNKTAEARAQYERVIREFPDQTNVVNEARLRIGGEPTAATANVVPQNLAPVEDSQIKRIRELIKNSPDRINAKTYEGGRTELHQAAKDGAAILQFLLENGADVHVTDNLGKTPLHLAAESGHKTAVETLLRFGADVNAQDGEKRTALNSAAQNNFKAVAEVLVAANAKLDLVDKWGYTPLHRAVSSKGISELLLAHGADVRARSKDGYTPLFMNNLSTDVAKLLVEKGADVNAQTDMGETPLHQAAITANVALIELLLSQHALPNPTNSSGETPLHLAAKKRSEEAINALLASGANPNIQDRLGRTTTYIAAAYSLNTSLKNLVAKHADLDLGMKWQWSQWTPLHIATANANQETVQMLLDGKADPNVINSSGWTPLDIVAARSNNVFNPNDSNTLLYSGHGAVAGTWADLTELIRAHGGKTSEDLVRTNFIWIKANRYNSPLFVYGSNSLNHFTFLDLFSQTRWDQIPFPNLHQMQIVRLDESGKTNIMDVNAQAILDSNDCSQNFALRWGDTIRVTEEDHPVNLAWGGFQQPAFDYLQKCLQRTVTIIIKSTTNQFVLVPNAERLPRGPVSLPRGLRSSTPALDERKKRADGTVAIFCSVFELRPFLYNTQLLRSSSDLTRVKVTRRVGNKGLQSFTFNTLATVPSVGLPDRPLNANTDLWLEDGDVIEVPEKP